MIRDAFLLKMEEPDDLNLAKPVIILQKKRGPLKSLPSAKVGYGLSLLFLISAFSFGLWIAVASFLTAVISLAFIHSYKLTDLTIFITLLISALYWLLACCSACFQFTIDFISSLLEWLRSQSFSTTHLPSLPSVTTVQSWGSRIQTLILTFKTYVISLLLNIYLLLASSSSSLCSVFKLHVLPHLSFGFNHFKTWFESKRQAHRFLDQCVLQVLACFARLHELLAWIILHAEKTILWLQKASEGVNCRDKLSRLASSIRENQFLHCLVSWFRCSDRVLRLELPLHVRAFAVRLCTLANSLIRLILTRTRSLGLSLVNSSVSDTLQDWAYQILARVWELCSLRVLGGF